ncbi:MAG TPA: ASKHA domain-containing protein [Methylomusa anaerophila]|uniref:CDP-6-deoxy-L-threo-D-glycero-4-hexulose-3-dehydrase reductase n=1 Tax=Methylomusa anaerophila TaxID=1930071 RepID=A0A348AQT7_9FIRM|nr:ASKHA domain-containing protein [Methylomusa anaerophila]BBB93435.1 CDP-6-deoxy-L-threo-D-glycero-4-hexulose-3-dehydrase reductase [Methylomusa anaerophila]HML90059.1 ASKHA domain-containing protein [Methylomusa anaerophila]
MARVTFKRADKKVTVETTTGVSILAAARKAGILIESPCNGNGTCGKCKVKILNQELVSVDGNQATGITEEERAQGIVLACLTPVAGELVVEVAARPDGRNVQIIQHGHSLEIPVAGLVDKRYNDIADRTEIWADNELLGVEQGNTRQENYGLVVDIGTTTLVAALFDLNTGQELATAAALNPQSHHAQDVLSRIKYASTPDGLEVMHSEFISILNQMIGDTAGKAEIRRQNIYEIIFSGNTCMLHLAMNIDPSSLGKFPYNPVITGGTRYRAGEYGIDAAEFAQIYLPPVMSAYVGADITSGILAAQLKKLKGLTLFVDIGTNGEMVLAADGGLIATSTAAGPAFEGMNIACGMRAAPGAIEKFNIAGDGTIEIKTIGNEAPAGICGSGLIDIVGELVKHRVIQATGRLNGSATLPAVAARVIKKDGKPVFQITDAVYLSQKDIRQVQLAKGAIRAGIEALLAKSGMQPEGIDRVYIAGSFGYHLNPESLINIGLLPPAFRDKIEFLGNTSKTGGQAFLLNNATRREMAEVVADVEVLELATTDNFDKLFVSCLNF